MSKNWIKLLLLVAAAPFFALSSLLYIYDPVMLFHKPWGRNVTLDSNMRLQASGVIRSLDHDAYILGTSMMENTSAFKASEILGSRFANISMSGSDFYERSFPLELALEKGAKHIIYSVDSHYLSRREGHPRFKIEDFAYLYGGLERFSLYLQHKYIACAMSLSVATECVGRSTTLDMPNEWISSPGHNVRFGGLDNWFSAYNNNQIKSALSGIVSIAKAVQENRYNILEDEDLEKEIALSLEYINEYILSYIEENPSVRFDLVFPPYSRIRYAEWHQLNGTNAKIHEAVVRHLANASADLENLTVYGYEDQSFVDDIGNYKDTGHYDIWVNEMQLDDIRNKASTVDSLNIDYYLVAAREKALAFDIVSLGELVSSYLNEL